MDPLISVVTPSWNQGVFLSACIESVMGAEDGLVEHIIIDNCSDDETHEVMGRYPHLITVIESDDGQSDALNKGFAKARGEWILWLNADDFLLPGTLTKYVEIVRGGSRANLIYGHMVFVDEEGTRTRTVYQPQWRYHMTWFGLCQLPSTGALFRAQILKDNPLDLDFHMIMDTEWSLRNGAGVRVKRLQRETFAFRISEFNKTAENIQTGGLTPRHAEERKILGGRYKYYGLRAESHLGPVGYHCLIILRKLIRLRILADKALSKLLGSIRR